jgi:hypothetical protein
MVEASSHVPLYPLVESTQMVYGVSLFFVSARTNKVIIIKKEKKGGGKENT